ncbi:hypothetical protein Esti_001114 [Eimeria stiedai]
MPRYQHVAVHFYAAIRNILEEYLHKKWIQSSCSSYATPVVLVPKKGGPPGSPGSSLVVNCRPLNAVTIAQVPLPVIEDVLASSHGAKCFTTPDMERGFHQVRMAPKDHHKAAFRTFIGQCEWRVMPFGLKGEPGTFQAIMSCIFFDMLAQGVLSYMDYVLVYTATVEKHLRLLDSVLARLLQHKMSPKLEKCKYAARSIEYLGCRVGADGIHPSMEKVSAIALSPTELANETQTAVATTEAEGTFQWTAAHSSAVQALKDRLIHYIKLSLPDLTKPFILRTDASGVAIGAVLEQDDKPLGFLSKRLSDAKMLYWHDQELLAIVRALKRWRHFLIAAETPNTNSGPSHESPSPLLHDNVHASPPSSLSDAEMQGVGDEDRPFGHLPDVQPNRDEVLLKGHYRVPISHDFFGGLPLSGDGCDTILAVVDSLSKMAHFIPTKGSLSTADFIRLFADRLVGAWQPQTDGQMERANRTIEQMLRAYIQSREEEWPYLLPALELAYNCTSHSATGLSFFEVMLGENPLRAQDLDLIFHALSPLR